MGKILILDDHKEFVKLLKFELQKRYSETIYTYTNIDVEQLKKIDIDLIFLDIEMPGITGIEIAKILKEKEKKPIIIFVSNTKLYVHDGYRERPFFFIRKTELAFDLREAVEKLDQFGFRNENKVIIENKIIDLNQTLYFKAERPYIKAEQLNRKSIYVKTTLKKLDSILTTNYFVKVNKSHYINMRHIKSINDDNVEFFASDEVIALARNRKQILIEEFKKGKLHDFI